MIDTRGELGPLLSGKELMLDVLEGYPRGLGMEIAVRTMGAQTVVCDEIGGEEEAEAILRTQHAGVGLLATAHAHSLKQLLCRPFFAQMHACRAFDVYVGLSRTASTGRLRFDITEWEEAEIIVAHRGRDYSCR